MPLTDGICAEVFILVVHGHKDYIQDLAWLLVLKRRSNFNVEGFGIIPI